MASKAKHIFHNIGFGTHLFGALTCGIPAMIYWQRRYSKNHKNRVEEFTTAEQKSKALLAAEAKENFATLSPEQLEKWIAARKHVAS